MKMFLIHKAFVQRKSLRKSRRRLFWFFMGWNRDFVVNAAFYSCRRWTVSQRL